MPHQAGTRRTYESAYLWGPEEALETFVETTRGLHLRYKQRCKIQGVAFVGYQVYLGPLKHCRMSPKVRKHFTMDSFLEVIRENQAVSA